MRKISILLISLLLVCFAFGKPVTLEKARLVANNYLSVSGLKSGRNIAGSFSKTYNGITTYHVFNFEGGGFVVVSADDVARPILAKSDEGFLEIENSSPEVLFWLDSYSKEIAGAVSANIENSEADLQWQNILSSEKKSILTDVTVGPLIQTSWDQKAYYNYFCPSSIGTPTGYGGKVPVGCVATTMGQIMKYYNFPDTGVGTHSYSHGTFGKLSADFGITKYNFANMPNQASSAKYRDLARLLADAGVSVNMDYAKDGSGALNSSVPIALTKYFNYDNKTISLAYMSEYTASEWQSLLISELNSNRPLYYSGYDPEGGHAWVCDGYQTSNGTTMFHMNWGWSGSGNGYFAIGALNSGNGDFNSGNAVVYGIKPGNPDLIVRFTNLDEVNLVPYGSNFSINCSVVKGTPTAVKLYIDKQVVLNTTQTEISYSWNTLEAGIGEHQVKVEAMNATDTVSWEITIGLSEWSPKASNLTEPLRGIKYMHAVNPDVVWATATDGRSGSQVIQEFTKTTDAGNTWTSGKINNCSGLEPAMIFGLSKDTAYVPMYKISGSRLQGIYVTADGGTTWNRQSTAKFDTVGSFPNVVHFFNKNDGFCMGDPKGGLEFEIYTTSNGGATWNPVSGSYIPDPLNKGTSNVEYGVVGYYSAVGNKAWFGTSLGRIYRSQDKGLHWEVSDAKLGSVQIDVEFKDALNGIAQEKSSTGEFSKTSDGGVTWNAFSSTGYYGTSDFCYVPGTTDTWVSTGIGAYFSFDGGHSWAAFPGTQTDQFLAVDFSSNKSGWSGSFNTDAFTGGIYKFTGTLDPSNVLNPAVSLIAEPNANKVKLSWTEPETVPISYNIYRNDTLLSNTTSLQFTDEPVSAGTQNYCVTAVYTLGQSTKNCTSTFVTLNIPTSDEASFRVYPNPASDVINLITPVKYEEVRIINNLGKVVYQNSTNGTNLRILTEGLAPGMYILQIYAGLQPISKKIMIIR